MIGRYLSHNACQKLKNPDKYEGEDFSKLSKLLQPWWTWCAEQMPLWVSPNAITIGGALVLLVAYLTVELFGGEEPPPWMYLFNAFGVFFFQTADAVDGKQARRTGTSSVLGDFIDHVTDLVTLLAALFAGVIALQLEPSVVVIYMIFACCSSCFLLHWEAANTGRLDLPDGGSITEAQAVLIFFHLVSAVYAPIWKVDLLVTLGIVDDNSWLPGGLQNIFQINFLVALVAVGIVSSGACWASLKNGYTRMINKSQTVASLQLLPYLSTIVMAVAYVLLVRDQTIYENREEMTLLLWVVSFVAVGLGARMVVYRICKEPFPYFTIGVLFPIPFVLLNLTVLNVVSRIVAMRVAFLVSFGWLAHYYCSVVIQIANFMKIPVFAMPKKEASRKE